MSEARIIRSSSQQNLGVRSLSDHRNVSSSKTKNLSKQSIDPKQNEIPDGSKTKLKSTEKILPKTSRAGEVQTIRKCLRKGSRVCYTDMENITVLRRIPERDTSRISFASIPEDEGLEKVDSYRSGESLFKTFTFEQTRDVDDPETVKCIEFWKSVMKKNLAPIKCTLLENGKRPAEKKKRKSSKSSKETLGEIKKSSAGTEKLNFNVDGAKLWSEALREIRKRKLDQLKLYVRDRCKYCTDPFTRELRDKLGVESTEEQQSVILSLNEWKPRSEQMDLMDNFSGPSLKKRYSMKTKKASSSQTAETRVHEKSTTDQGAKEPPASHSKAKIAIPKEGVPATESKPPVSGQESAKKLPSILKTTSKGSQQRSGALSDSSKKSAAPQMSSVEVQAPNIKCPCESDTCVCPHRAAARNSRTSFVEIARKNMLDQDGSTEKFFPKSGEACICENFSPQPWTKLTCVNDPCPAKMPKVKVQESSSDFNLNRILGVNEDICVCTKTFDVICPSENCKNKISHGSLIEGFPEVKGAENEYCVCSTEDSEAPCTSDVCPTKTPKKISTTCICASNLPWSQATCQSWNCPHHRRIRIRTADDEKITFRGHPPIREITSTCLCKEEMVWTDVTCRCQVCAGKSDPDSIMKFREKKTSVMKTTLKTKSSSKELMLGRKSSRRGKSTSRMSLDKVIKEKEKVKQKVVPVEKGNKCVCSAAPPWKIVSCHKRCNAKDGGEKTKSNLSLLSVDHGPKDEECVCKDANIEPICKVHKCRNRETHVEYPPPCICPKDFEETEHEFRCISETCKMKKIDRSCLCRLEPDTPCDAKTCVSKPRGSKTLTQNKKPLRYDPKCICKVRGLPTTQEVSCLAPECPFQKKYPKMAKKKIPKLFVPPPYEYKTSSEETVTKCICNTKDASISVKCHSLTCKKKNKSDQSGDTTMEYYDEEQEVCICKDEQTEFTKDQEVICNTIQCHKTSVGEDVTNDKCVCANLEEPCYEPTCPSADNEVKHKICSEIIMQTKDRPYCYICGHYECASTKKLTKTCEEVYTDMDDM
ncbi:uncharacterized protein LOC123314332 [Coccinella septempunctata]|uniref:uncharacterized protein LOC123314332 n=1 Tax=Coccinella septempunctata TaxID=41139 RepID=UPI001D0731CD|nr:uncharacterized protein LOC123314332 [Coccinella septempunctata]